MSTTSILLNTTKQGRVTKRKKKLKVIFLDYNEAEEEERHQKGVQLRKRLRKKKEAYKQYKKDMKQLPERVYNVLVNPDNQFRLNQLAQNCGVFRLNFFAFFGIVASSNDNNINPVPFQDIIGLQSENLGSAREWLYAMGVTSSNDNNINPNPPDANAILTALIHASVPFQGIIGLQSENLGSARACLIAMGALMDDHPGFRTILNPPQVSDGSSDQDEKTPKIQLRERQGISN